MSGSWRRVLACTAVPVLAELTGRGLLRKKHAIARDGRRSWTQNHEIQLTRLAGMLQHAARTVPFYSHRLPRERVPAEEALQLLRTLPTVGKSEVRTHFAELQSRRWYPRTRQVTTGGSTGVPTTVRKNPQHLSWMASAEWLFFEWGGYRPGMPILKIWGSERDVLEGTVGWRARVQNAVTNRHIVNAFSLDMPTATTLIQHMGTYVSKRYLVYGYAESLHLLAQLILKQNTRPPSPVAVLTTAGTLFPEMRGLIREAFGAPVMNKYGSREINNIACECVAGHGLHAPSRLNVIEILGRDGSSTPEGEIGELVITSLTNRAMPLLRYRIGDVGRVMSARTECTIHFPVIDHIVGRTSDMFVTEDGTYVHGEFFSHIFYAYPWIGRFRVVQNDVSAFVIEIELASDLSDLGNEQRGELEERISGQIRTLFGGETRIRFRYTRRLETPSSGKFRFTICNIGGREGVGPTE